QRGNTGPATTRPPFRPAIWRAPWPGVLDNACCGKNCTRWRGARTRRTRPHGRRGRPCGIRDLPRRLFFDEDRVHVPISRRNRFRRCGTHRPLRADARSSFRWNAARGPDQIERAQHFERTAWRTHGGVGPVKGAGRGFQVGVTQQGLNDNEVGPVVQQMRGKGVAERMRRHWFRKTGQPRRLPAYFKNGFTREGASRLFTWEEPPCRPLPAPVSDQYFAEWVGEHDLAVLVTLAPANPDDLAVAIKVADLQVGRFRHPESRSVQGRQNRPMAEVLRRFEQSFDLFLAQDDGELLLVSGQRNPFDLDFAVQGVAVEKTETAYGLNVRRDLDFLLVQQEQLPRADLFGAQIFGRLVKVFGELGGRADVAFRGRRRVVADLEVFQHPLS